MKKYTKWLLLVAMAVFVAMLPLQAQQRGDKGKGDRNQNEQGFKGDKNDGHSKGDKSDNKDGRDRDRDRDPNHDGDGDGHGCDKPPTVVNYNMSYNVGGPGAGLVVVSGAPSAPSGTVVTYTISSAGLVEITIDVITTSGVQSIPVFLLDPSTPFSLTFTVTGDVSIVITSYEIQIG